MRAPLRRMMAAGLIVAATTTWGLVNAPTHASAAPSASNIPADPYDVAGYAPDGTTNVAASARVASSSSYEMANESWAMSLLNNGVAGKADGWSTNPYDKVQNPATAAWVSYDLGASHDIDRVVVFPRDKSFPADYRIEVSADGNEYRSVFTSTGNAAGRTAPQVVDLADVEGRFLRLYVTRRNGVPTGDGYLVQLSELAVFGGLNETILSIEKPALLLETGTVERLPHRAVAPSGTPKLVWTSSDVGVATVDGSGVVTAVAPGKTVITMAAPQLGKSTSIPVEVRNEVERVEDKFVISAFWPPTTEYVNETQYSYLGDAGIDLVLATQLHTSKEINLEMARLAHKNGFQIMVQDGRIGPGMVNMTDEQIRKEVLGYTNVPGVGGFFIVDEPYDPTPFARVFNTIKEVAPEYDAHLNFQPSSVYGSEAEFARVTQGWLDRVGDRGYLMYDRYPFGWTENSLDYTGFLNNMNTVRKVGLANNVKTAQYLQAVGVPGNFRRMNPTEIRYEANMALAYGYKNLSYFTWWTPTNRGEVFTDAIITADGKKTDLFEPVKQLNSEIHALGPTLMRLDAKEVYLNGQTWGQEAVPADFLVRAQSNDDLTFSYMRDRENGRNYVMVVNNSFTQAKDVSLRFGTGIGSLEEISRQTGKPVGVALDNGALNRRFDKGEAVLYMLPAGYDYDARPTPVNVNIAERKPVTADSTQSGGDWSPTSVTDGQRFAQGAVNGWSTPTTEASRKANLTVDLGREQDLNRIDLYPAGTAIDYGGTFPRDFTLQVSSDGESWRTVRTVSGQGRAAGPLSYSFDATKGRYVRIAVQEMNRWGGRYAAALAELEVYHDDGGTAAPESPPATPAPPPYVEGQNIAKNKTVVVSSTTPDSTYEQWGYASKFLVDGRTDNGWTSNIRRHTTPNAQEWAVVGLRADYDVSEVKVHAIGAFPVDYKVQLSSDGGDWTTIADVKGDDGSTAKPRVFTLDKPVRAAFVRIVSSKLRMGGHAADGYLMQVAEIEAFGTPASDRQALRQRIAEAEGKSEPQYTAESWAGLTEALAKARTVAAAAHPYQYEVDKAERALATALEALVRHPNWERAVEYRKGARVIHNDRAYEAQWSTRAEVPGVSPRGAWAEVGVPVQTPEGRYASWTTSWIYTSGDIVAHDGHLWKAQWWTRNQEPGDRNGPWLDLGSY
ncbi:discoidin domain-containing protein [Micromonospora okii]|uniref:discoidin domain-containing protein n=1 Tax=Micromonospora okii TaxID=1182970 RepID=UPI001E39B530|nr:discoidin domain-containing protein [Micromonospora okii]